MALPLDCLERTPPALDKISPQRSGAFFFSQQFPHYPLAEPSTPSAPDGHTQPVLRRHSLG